MTNKTINEKQITYSSFYEKDGFLTSIHKRLTYDFLFEAIIQTLNKSGKYMTTSEIHAVHKNWSRGHISNLLKLARKTRLIKHKFIKGVYSYYVPDEHMFWHNRIKDTKQNIEWEYDKKKWRLSGRDVFIKKTDGKIVLGMHSVIMNGFSVHKKNRIIPCCEELPESEVEAVSKEFVDRLLFVFDDLKNITVNTKKTKANYMLLEDYCVDRHEKLMSMERPW